ncbi:MAG: hypothetical protein WAO98_10755 [Alphaproteobacteria bacterium]
MASHIKLGFASAAAALALAGSATAQTAPPTVGGSIILNNSRIHGDLSAVVANGILATNSNIGLNNFGNSFGGYAAVTGTLRVAPINLQAVISAKDTILTGGNISAAAAIGSALDSSNIGYNNVLKSQGFVSQYNVAATSFAPGVIDTVAVVNLENVRVDAGDISAASLIYSQAGDLNLGLNNYANSYGNYSRGTFDSASSVTIPGVTGSIYATDSVFPRSNFSAATGVGSSLFSTNVGARNVNESIGYVGRASFGPQPN